MKIYYVLLEQNRGVSYGSQESTYKKSLMIIENDFNLVFQKRKMVRLAVNHL